MLNNILKLYLEESKFELNNIYGDHMEKIINIDKDYFKMFVFSDIHGNYDDDTELTAPKLKVSAISFQLGVHF